MSNFKPINIDLETAFPNTGQFVVWVVGDGRWPATTHWIQLRDTLFRVEAAARREQKELALVMHDRDEALFKCVKAAARGVLGLPTMYLASWQLGTDGHYVGPSMMQWPPHAVLCFSLPGELPMLKMHALRKRITTASRRRPNHSAPRARIIEPWDDMTLLANLSEEPKPPVLGAL